MSRDWQAGELKRCWVIAWRPWSNVKIGMLTTSQKQFAEFETKGVAGWFDHHSTLSLPEEREEDDDKVMLTRYTPLGVVGAICPCKSKVNAAHRVRC